MGTPKDVTPFVRATSPLMQILEEHPEILQQGVEACREFMLKEGTDVSDLDANPVLQHIRAGGQVAMHEMLPFVRAPVSNRPTGAHGTLLPDGDNVIPISRARRRRS